MSISPNRINRKLHEYNNHELIDLGRAIAAELERRGVDALADQVSIDDVEIALSGEKARLITAIKQRDTYKELADTHKQREDRYFGEIMRFYKSAQDFYIDIDNTYNTWLDETKAALGGKTLPALAGITLLGAQNVSELAETEIHSWLQDVFGRKGLPYAGDSVAKLNAKNNPDIVLQFAGHLLFQAAMRHAALYSTAIARDLSNEPAIVCHQILLEIRTFGEPNMETLALLTDDWIAQHLKESPKTKRNPPTRETIKEACKHTYRQMKSGLTDMGYIHESGLHLDRRTLIRYRYIYKKIEDFAKVRIHRPEADHI